MKNTFKGISIRIKLLALLVALTVVVLIAYAFVMLRDFRADKVAYIFDSVLSNSRSVASLVRTELENAIGENRALMRMYDASTKTFAPEARKRLVEDSPFKRIDVFEYDKSKAQFLPAGSLTSPEAAAADVPREVLNEVLTEALKSRFAVRANPNADSSWVFAMPATNEEESNTVVVALVKRGTFLDAFFRRQVQSTFLLNEDGDVILQPAKPAKPIDSPSLASAIEMLPQTRTQPFGVLEQDKANHMPLLFSFAEVGVGGLRVLSAVPTETAFEATRMVVRKSGIFLIFLVSLAMFISVLSSNGLTTSLKRLHEAIITTSTGNFGVQVPDGGEDEVGDLSKGFNHMVREINRLMKETEEKVRMEGELKTAQLVQSTLFPDPVLNLQNLKIRGYYQPASECGGDWWNYSVSGPSLYLTISDATGHGVPAALITSAARSASAIVSGLGGISVGERLAMLNRAIAETAQRKMQMTCFFAHIDVDTGLMTYANASHEPPLIIHDKGKPIKRTDIKLLRAEPGARLGESETSTYPEATHQLQGGDTVLLYTDGLPELQNAKGDTLGDRRLSQMLVKAFNDRMTLDETLTHIQNTIEEFREGAPLADDVTFLLLKWG